MKIKSITQAKNLSQARVLVRCDFNVPIKNGRVVDDFKIKKTLPTIVYLLQKKAKVILTSHLGRPDGKFSEQYSLKPVANYLKNALAQKVELVSLNDLDNVDGHFKPTKFGQVIMLENTRFNAGEKKNSKEFAKKLASIADIFVVECFGVAHRIHASIVGPAKYLPTYAGLLAEKEILGLSKAIVKPKKPFVVVLGGAKTETKIPILKNLIKKADYILLGGGIVNTWMLAKGYEMGSSLADKNMIRKVLYYSKKKKIIMPIDVVVGSVSGKKAMVKKITADKKICSRNFGVYDIGPETVRMYAEYIKKANTIVWNGALGYFEQNPYQHGTYAIARLIASRSKGSAFGIAGGGETVEVLKKLHLLDDIDLVSTGGGAMLEFLSNKKLPGLKAIV
ncbi:MAG: phosphoglycerate kinase [bacterium]